MLFDLCDDDDDWRSNDTADETVFDGSSSSSEPLLSSVLENLRDELLPITGESWLLLTVWPTDVGVLDGLLIGIKPVIGANGVGEE